MQDDAVLRRCSCNFDRCFNVGITAGLVTEALEAGGAVLSGGTGMLSGSSAWIAGHDSICRYTALADSGGGSARVASRGS